jgi:hypothetical protein
MLVTIWQGPGRLKRPLCVFLHLHPAPQHVDSSHAAWRPTEAILATLRGILCKTLQVNFGEILFHALC